MHILQPKHSKLGENDVKELLKKFNISLSQLPKIKKEDPCTPENCEVGDIVKIERKIGERRETYFRVVVEK